MRRRCRQIPETKTKNSVSQPLAEGVIPLDKTGRRKWAQVNDLELSKLASEFIKVRGISNRSMLEREDKGLYRVLSARGLIDSVGLREKRMLRRWGNDNEALLSFALGFIEEKGIRSVQELGKEDSGLCCALRRRGLIEGIRFIESPRQWGTDKQVLAMAKRFIKARKIRNREELRAADSGLHSVLYRRRIIGQVQFQEKHLQRKWGTDEEVLQIAKRHIAENGVRKRTELEDSDTGLYEVLRKRGLLEQAGLGTANKARKWTEDKDAIAHARKLVGEMGIKTKAGLKKADSGLHEVLRKKGLLDQIEFSKSRKLRKWGSNDELLAFARTYLQENGIRRRVDLEESNPRLYAILWKRNLLGDAGLAAKDEQRKWGTDESVLGFARKFMKKSGIRTKSGLETADLGLYTVLRRRKLLCRLDFEKRKRTWGSDGEVLGFARKLVQNKGVISRKGLERADPGLYSALVKRKLIDAVFSVIELSSHKKAVRGVIDSLESFGDDS